MWNVYADWLLFALWRFLVGRPGLIDVVRIIKEKIFHPPHRWLQQTTVASLKKYHTNVPLRSEPLSWCMQKYVPKRQF